MTTGTTEKTKEQLWAEMDTAEANGTAVLPEAGATETQRATDQELQQAAAAATSEASKTEAATEQVTAPADAKQEAADPYAGLPQAVKDELIGLKTLAQSLGQRLRNAEGHIGGINSRLKDQLQAAQQTTAQGNEAPSAAQIAAAQGDSQAMAKLKAEYPEFGAAIEAALNERLAAHKPAAQAADANQPTARQVLDRIDQSERHVAVEVRHPGWQTAVKSPAFIGWLERQPREYQLLAASDAPQDAIRLLDIHKEAMKTAGGNRQQRLDTAAALPSGRSSTAVRTKPIDQMSKAEYWAYLDQVDKQQRS